MEIEKEIVREVARGDKPYLRKSIDRTAHMRRVIENQRQLNDQILSSPVLFFPSEKWMKLNQKLLEIEKEIVREMAREGGVVYRQKKGGGEKRGVSEQCEVHLKMAAAEPAWGKPNHRK